MKRPVSVNVIGWLFIIASAPGILGAMAGLIVYRFVSIQIALGNIEPIPRDIIQIFGPFTGIFDNFGIFMIIQIIVFAYIIYVAVQFLKLKKWARDVLEVVSWLGIIITLIIGISLIITGNDFVTTVRSMSETPAPPGFFRLIFFSASATNLLFHLVPLGLIIWFLRKKELKKVFKHPNSTEDYP